MSLSITTRVLRPEAPPGQPQKNSLNVQQPPYDRALIEHFDSLCPVEQSRYPDDYRDWQQACLAEEEQKLGKPEFKSLLQILMEQDPLLKWHLNEGELLPSDDRCLAFTATNIGQEMLGRQWLPQ
ncbi:hypothetical protein D9M71_513190 [compost metagenome]